MARISPVAHAQKCTVQSSSLLVIQLYKRPQRAVGSFRVQTGLQLEKEKMGGCNKCNCCLLCLTSSCFITGLVLVGSAVALMFVFPIILESQVEEVRQHCHVWSLHNVKLNLVLRVTIIIHYCIYGNTTQLCTHSVIGHTLTRLRICTELSY